MNEEARFSYVDRRDGQLRRDVIHARGLLRWMYDSQVGWWLTNALFSRPWLSQLYAWWQRQPWSRRRIAPFVVAHEIDLGESLRRIDEFTSFNDFIARKIDLSCRPLTADADAVACPADCRVLVYPYLATGTRLPLKRGLYDLPALLGDDTLARTYEGGAALIGRLYLADYHHFHFPLDGVPGPPRDIPGRCFATSPYSTRFEVAFMARNRRTLTLFETERCGRVALVEIGAFTVASIRQAFAPGEPVAKGQHKGWFELGGSVVVVLFEPGRVAFDADLVTNSADSLETFVRMGERIGVALTTHGCA